MYITATCGLQANAHCFLICINYSCNFTALKSMYVIQCTNMFIFILGGNVFLKISCSEKQLAVVGFVFPRN